jgi:hypothetical protein
VNTKNKEKEDKDKERDTGASGRWLRKLSRKIGGRSPGSCRGRRVSARCHICAASSKGTRSRCSKACSACADIQVRDIMVPRAQMTVLNRDDDPACCSGR